MKLFAFAHISLVAALFSIVNCQDSTTTSSAIYPTSTDGSCGSSVNETCLLSQWGNCCSQHGFCGNATSYCGAGCQHEFGECTSNSSKISTTGSCGADTGFVCPESIWGPCCSKNGFCGDNATYCGAGCQSDFGDCESTFSSTTSSAGPSNSTFASSTTSPTVSISTIPPVASVRKTPITQTTGFKAGISVMAVVLFLLLFSAIAFFLLRRRRRNQKSSTISTHKSTTAELHDEKKAPVPTYAEAEGHQSHPQELDGSGLQELPPHDHD